MVQNIFVGVMAAIAVAAGVWAFVMETGAFGKDKDKDDSKKDDDNKANKK